MNFSLPFPTFALLFIAAVAVAALTQHKNGGISSMMLRERRLMNVHVPHDPRTMVEKTVTLANDSQMLSCLHTILTENQLPIGTGSVTDDNNSGTEDKSPLKVFAHHWDAQNPQWNVNDRMAPVPQLEQQLLQSPSSSCSVWEVGANTRADDTMMFLVKYPKCKYHTYEPIPDFSVLLEQHWSDEPRVTTHAYGLGPKDTTFPVERAALNGQSTYLGDSTNNRMTNNEESIDGNDMVFKAHIKSFHAAVSDAGGQLPTLLHINCEGCEWDMLPAAKKAGFLDHIEVIQFGSHNYGTIGLGNRVWQLCEIRQMLSDTHDMVKGGTAFGWERWVRRHS